jgi:hypothetical protein
MDTAHIITYGDSTYYYTDTAHTVTHRYSDGTRISIWTQHILLRMETARTDIAHTFTLRYSTYCCNGYNTYFYMDAARVFIYGFSTYYYTDTAIHIVMLTSCWRRR